MVNAIDTITRRPRSFTGIETVVVAGQGKSSTSLYEAIKGRVRELYRIGDAPAPPGWQTGPSTRATRPLASYKWSIRQVAGTSVLDVGQNRSGLGA